MSEPSTNSTEPVNFDRIESPALRKYLNGIFTDNVKNGVPPFAFTMLTEWIGNLTASQTPLGKAQRRIAELEQQLEELQKKR